MLIVFIIKQQPFHQSLQNALNSCWKFKKLRVLPDKKDSQCLFFFKKSQNKEIFSNTRQNLKILMKIHIFRRAPLIFGHLAHHSCTDNEVFSTALLLTVFCFLRNFLIDRTFLSIFPAVLRTSLVWTTFEPLIFHGICSIFEQKIRPKVEKSAKKVTKIRHHQMNEDTTKNNKIVKK